MRLELPTPDQVRAAREAARLTTDEAAALAHVEGGKRWREYEAGTRVPDLARWELFLIKARYVAEFCELIGRKESPPEPRRGRPPSRTRMFEAPRLYTQKTTRRK